MLFFAAVTSVVVILVPLFYKKFFDIITTSENHSLVVPSLVHLVVIIFGLNMILWAAFRIASFANSYLEARVMSDLRQQAFTYMLQHSYTFFSNNFTGSLVQRVSRFARAFERLIDRIVFDVLALVIRIVGMAVVLWFINPIISSVLIVWVTLFLSINYILARMKLKYDVESAAADSRTTGALSDSITNANTIQLFTGLSSESIHFAEIANTQAMTTLAAWNFGNTVEAVQSFLMFGIEFLLFYFAIHYWSTGVITVGTFVLIQVYFFNLTGQLWGFGRIIRDIHEGLADGKEMADILYLPHEIQDIPTAKNLEVTQGEVEFKNVKFNFNETRTVLDDISLKIASGEKVALIGPSGAGKSTFVRLLLRFYDITAGSILVDGQNIREVTQESLRSQISLVPQDPILFHRTLKENIKYGKPDATDVEVFEAARLAHCDEFIKDLPKGYDTYVGERGIKLSGGERQRVAIARAILKNAPILILDEATSSLDSHSESLIQDALDTLMKGKTVIVIAHRLSTIRKMDRIVVIDSGKILEEGTHDELVAREHSLYKNLWTLQAGGFLVETPEEE